MPVRSRRQVHPGSVNERAPCSLKGDCLRYGRHVISAGDEAASSIVAWVKQHCGAAVEEEGEAAEAAAAAAAASAPSAGASKKHSIDMLSVWGVSVVGSEGREASLAMLGHALLNPYRVIVLPLQPSAPSDAAIYRFGAAGDMGFDFRTVYGWLHGLEIPWHCSDVVLTRYEWDVQGWSSLKLLERQMSTRIWSRRGAGPSAPPAPSGLRQHFELADDALRVCQAACKAMGKAARAPAPATRAAGRGRKKHTPKAKDSKFGQVIKKAQKAKARASSSTTASPPVVPPAVDHPAIAPVAPPTPPVAAPVVDRDDLTLADLAALEAGSEEELDLGQPLDTPSPEMGPPRPPPATPAPSALASSVTGPAVRVYPSEYRPRGAIGPEVLRGADMAFISGVLGPENWTALRNTGHTIKYDKRGGRHGCYYAAIYEGFGTMGLRRDVKKLGGRFHLRDDQDHERCIRNAFKVVIEDQLAGEVGVEVAAELCEDTEVGSHTSSESESALSYKCTDSECDIF